MEILKLHPVCKDHNIKMIQKGYHKESPDYPKWICLKCEEENKLKSREKNNDC